MTVVQASIEMKSYCCFYCLRICRVMDLSTRSLQLHNGDADEGIHPWRLVSTHSAATSAAARTASPSRTHSSPASLTAAGNSPSSLPATLRPTAISPASSPAPLKGRRSVCESDSSCHSASESYSSSCTSCSTVSGSHHSQCLDSFPTHAQHPQHTQHAGRSNLDATPQQRQQSTAGTACESSLVNQLPALRQDWLPTELEQAGAPTATAAEVSSWAGPQDPAAATAQLTAQHIRQRYPHLFGPDCNTISLQSACDAVVCSKSERDSSNELNTAPSTAPGASSSDSATEDSNTSSTAVVSQGQRSEVLRAGQYAGQQGQHAAALHESPLRLLLKESNAAMAGAIQAGMQDALPLTCSTAAYCSHRSLTSPWAGRCEALLQLVIHLSIQLVSQSAT